MTCLEICFGGKTSSTPKQNIYIGGEIPGFEDARLYSCKELRIATENFSLANKLGEGGFGSVFKARMKDGTLAAVKVLSAESKQGRKEFLTEIVVISGLKHENLVDFYGCCIEGTQRMLVYGYLENNSLAQTLLGENPYRINFNWKTRTKICIGVAQGLAYLHEEARPYVVHRDIKASNILLDKDLTPKISDFGLAKLFPPEMTHASTQVAGTLGYLAPEYAIQGKLTRKADIYSFGIVLMEIVTGRCNTNKRLPVEEQYLLERVWKFYETGKLFQLVDTSLTGDFDVDEACRYLKIALLCTQIMPKARPSMSSVVKMLKGEMTIKEDQKMSEPGMLSELIGLRTSKNSTSITEFARSSKQCNYSSSGDSSLTCGTMTFNSIYDRNT